MTVKATGASSASTKWLSIDWKAAEQHVKRLQMRIAKAIREGRPGKAKALQWILTHSFYAKALAVRKVSQNKGSKTPGVDGVVWNSDAKKMKATLSIKRRGYRPSPLRRVRIPKKNGKTRPLGIPCAIDRGHQALHHLALEPVAGTLADPNAYGFRPKRSVADAIEQCFKMLCRKASPQWILEGDIRACFDEIGHDWLLDNIPMDTVTLKKWLKSGYIEKGMFYRTDSGTPQGGLISPTLCVMTLQGLEQAVKKSVRARGDSVNCIVYADDFVITGASKEVLVNKVKPAVKAFLKERDLELSEEKTKITHIKDGFDFLGFNIRKYKSGKLLIKPSKPNVQKFIENVKSIIKKHKTIAAGELISILNPKIQGWGNFYRHAVSSRTFSYIDHTIYMALTRWARRRHPNKSIDWIVRKYFNKQGRGAGNDTFYGKVTIGNQLVDIQLSWMSEIKIKRHLKIKGAANPYDPSYSEYFRKRGGRKPAWNHWYYAPYAAA